MTSADNRKSEHYNASYVKVVFGVSCACCRIVFRHSSAAFYRDSVAVGPDEKNGPREVKAGSCYGNGRHGRVAQFSNTVS